MDEVGCLSKRTNHYAMDYPEVTCKLNGAVVDITDWSQATKDQRDAPVSLSIGMGYQIIGVGEHITAGSESMRAAKKIQRLTDGSSLSAS